MRKVFSKAFSLSCMLEEVEDLPANSFLYFSPLDIKVVSGIFHRYLFTFNSNYHIDYEVVLIYTAILCIYICEYAQGLFEVTFT